MQRSLILVRPDPLEGESPFGYLLRLVDVNGLMSGDHLLELIVAEGRRAPSLWAVATQPFWMRALAVALNKPTEQLLAMLYEYSNDTREAKYTFNESPLPRWAFRTKSAHACVACLREEGHTKSIWDLTVIDGCLIHGNRLQTHCPQCSAPLVWSRTEVMFCDSCKFDLRLADTARLSAAERERLKATSQIFNTSGGTINVGNHTISKAGWHSLLALVLYLVKDELSGDSDDLTIPHDDALDRKDLASAFDTLQNPGRLDSLLHSYLSSRAARFSSLGAKAWTVTISDRLATRQYRGAEFDFVRAVVERCVKAIAKLDSLRGCVEGHHTRHGDNFTFGKTAQILGLPRGLLTSDTAIKGLTKIDCLAVDGKSVSGLALNSLLSKLRPQVTSAMEAKTITVARLVVGGTLATAGRTIWDLIIALRDGKLHALAWDKTQPFSTMQLRRKDLEEFLKTRKANDGFLSVPEIAKRLSTYPDAIYRLIRAGILKAQERVLQKSVKQVCMTVEELDAFDAEYALAGTLARDIGANPTNMTHKIRHAGVEPVSGPGLDGGLVFAFRRKDLLAIDLAAVAKVEKYTSTAGRPKTGESTRPPEFAEMELIESAAVMARLGISSQRLGRLVKDGWLTCVEHGNQLGNRRMFEKHVIDAYCRKYRENPEWITIEDAAVLLADTLHAFRKNWTETGRLKTETDGLGIFLSRAQVKEAVNVNREQLTARQAQRLIGVDKATLANWHRLGRIAPVSGPGVDTYGNFLFDRTAVLELSRFCRDAGAQQSL